MEGEGKFGLKDTGKKKRKEKKTLRRGRLERGGEGGF